LTDSLRDLRDWMFRGILFESEAERFRSAGLQVGADQRKVEESRLAEAIRPFEIELRNEAVLMARTYALLYCFENSVRDLIKERLSAKHDINWWEKGVTEKVKKFAEDRQRQAAEQQTWLEGQKSDLLGFVDFSHLSDIITNAWTEFSDLIPTQHWLKQRMDELEKARNFIAHHRLLLPSEIRRIEMYVADWNRVVGL